MKVDLEERLGADRVLEPRGFLPQPALRLDPSPPVRPSELEIAVERLCLDSTSFRDLRERSGGDQSLMAERITEIVAVRGKMHNPDTDSGGILHGTVSAVGGLHSGAPALGEEIVTLGSLTLTPLRLDEVTRVHAASPQVVVRGRAYVSESAAWAPVPADLPLATAVDVLDVCAAASQVRALAGPGDTVQVFGAGHAGKLAMAAARDVSDGALVTAVDVDAAALERASALGLCDRAVATDLRDPLAAMGDLREAGVPPADLTVVVVNATGCESAALLTTGEGGTVLFFSMATSFSAAALAADGIGLDVRMQIGSGYSPDRGEYALELVRARPDLRDALGVHPAVGVGEMP